MRFGRRNAADEKEDALPGNATEESRSLPRSLLSLPRSVPPSNAATHVSVDGFERRVLHLLDAHARGVQVGRVHAAQRQQFRAVRRRELLTVGRRAQQ